MDFLAKNNLQFNNIKENVGTMKKLIKIQLFKWFLAAKFIRKEYEDLWSVSPVGAILLLIKIGKKSYSQVGTLI